MIRVNVTDYIAYVVVILLVLLPVLLILIVHYLKLIQEQQKVMVNELCVIEEAMREQNRHIYNIEVDMYAICQMNGLRSTRGE